MDSLCTVDRISHQDTRYQWLVEFSKRPKARLTQMIKTAVRSGWIKGFKMAGHSGNSTESSHCLCADDTLLTCEAEREQVLHLRVVMFAFEAVKINMAKSSMFSLIVESDINMLTVNLSIGAKFKDKSVWNGVIGKCEKKLTPWKQQYLSFGGRLTLINSVFDSIGNVSNVSDPMPASVVKNINKIRRQFLWEGNAERRKFHLVKWSISNLWNRGFWAPKAVKTPYGVTVWRQICNLLEKFNKDGFGLLRVQFSNLYRLAYNLKVLLADIITDSGWNFQLRRNLFAKKNGRR
ncbi:hypothetical protein H5410_012992 [Solanum commersonii]|uniref:Uncharacterized protein n=1 Tax=Solanum commersonii TaxID=4109 RepID=A0A9J6AT87_SOLCO|nr:hypothetical protein H5410_012992 [Solanum commersonii]